MLFSPPGAQLWSVDLQTCQGEAGPEGGAPESFKINTSFQTGEAEKKKNWKDQFGSGIYDLPYVKSI